MMLAKLAGALSVALLCASPALAQDSSRGSDSAPLPVESAATPTFTTIYRFLGGANARWPRGGVYVTGNGEVFGTTLYDGDCSTCGVVYRLTPPPKGKTVWTYKILKKFVLYKDGIGPTGPLAFYNGNLYGTTSAGGDTSCGCGTVFRISPTGAYKTLHVFKPSKLGSTPISGLLIDKDGTMYGNTSAGGAHGSGIIYKLTQAGGFSILYNFPGNFNGGPQGEMIFGKDGAIYGTQFGGGKYNQGLIFRITKGGSYSVLYNFKGVNQPGNSTDGAQPEGRLVLGKDGTIYGTTTFGGTPSGYGTAWSIKHVGTKWVYKQLYIFAGQGHNNDANLPHSGFIAGPGGSLYGTGAGGGTYQSGALYQLLPPKPGTTRWTYRTLHSFKGRDPNGDTPYGDITSRLGTIYGENLSGGHVGSSNCNDGCGTVFTYKP
jgi:uncharacterized repeat protein (TIGR03803 family)